MLASRQCLMARLVVILLSGGRAIIHAVARSVGQGEE